MVHEMPTDLVAFVGNAALGGPQKQRSRIDRARGQHDQPALQAVPLATNIAFNAFNTFAVRPHDQALDLRSRLQSDVGMGERHALKARLIVLSAGAVNSAALLLRSSERGVANKSDKVGRHFMNHNASAVLAVDPRTINDSIYQKTFGMNDFYLDDGAGGPPLAHIQLLRRATGQILKANLPR